MIEAPKLLWGAADWLAVAATFAAVLLAMLVVGYWRAPASRAVRWIAGTLKAIAILILALCLLEPLLGGTRARPGANQFVVLADNSQSMTLRDRDANQTRGDQLKTLTGKTAAWLAQLARDFDLRQYAFDSQLRAVNGFESLAFDGRNSDLGASLERLVRRYQGRPLAGVFLLTDGGATDAEALERVLAQSSGGKNADPNSPALRLPPIYPVLIGRDSPPNDVSLERVTVTQTNFEDTPVTLTAQVTTAGHRGKAIVAQLLDESGKAVEQQKLKVDQDGQPLAVRFRLKPEKSGVSFYRVRAAAEDQLDEFAHPEKSTEATLANNARMVAVDRGKGPYRVLYVSGRPNWEYKFLHRALQSDDQVQLVALIRIARREPKFNFIARAGEQHNPLFRGFDNPNKQDVEQYDQPVIVRMDTRDENELRGGFPKAADELYQYHAVILDDVESEFFTQDQMQLVKDFVRQRGGGLLMLGGQESFKNGKFDRTPVGDLLPVYADQVPSFPVGAKFRMALTREGWLEPWIRLRAEEDAERKRLESMPPFQTLNAIRGIKPGATVLARAQVETDPANPVPALVEQRFGQGRVAALLLGDLWRWGLRRPANTESDLEKAWRQTIRWLVGEVPQRVEVTASAKRDAQDPDGALALGVQVRDPTYAPLDNATVSIRVTGPDGKPLELRAEAGERQPGRYEALFVPRQDGAYRAEVTAIAPDGSEVGRAQTGWTSDPAAEEFKDLRPNADLLDHVARATGGQVVKSADLDSFVASLPTRNAQVTEPYIRPLWHQSWVFLLAIACLAAEWGLRRWKGLP
jgi:uncharacterized membrane protein